jgi:Protein of unknown function (DUF1557).
MLKIGDRLRRPDGSTITLSTKEHIESQAPVFNFEVENAHTYFVGNSHKNAVLVHNACPVCDGTGKKTITVERSGAYMFFSGMFSLGFLYTPVYGYDEEVDCECGTIPGTNYKEIGAEYDRLQKERIAGTGKVIGVLGDVLRFGAGVNPYVSAITVVTKEDPTRVGNNEITWLEWGFEAAGLFFPLISKYDDLPKVLKATKAANTIQHIDYGIETGVIVRFLKAGVSYTSNGYKYTTDALRRIVHVQGELRLQNAARNQAAQRAVRALGESGDHAGHLIAVRFFGSGDIDNLVPMAGRALNLSEWKIMENDWARALSAGQKVKVDITIQYGGEIAARPTMFNVTYWIDKVEFTRNFPN